MRKTSVAIVLFVYAVTSGPVNGWGTANVIAPLIISIAMAIAFFTYEAYIDPDRAALPPRVWNYPNVPVLVALGLNPFFWFGMSEYTLLSCIFRTKHSPDISLLPANASHASHVSLVSYSELRAIPPCWYFRHAGCGCCGNSGQIRLAQVDDLWRFRTSIHRIDASAVRKQ